MSGIWYTLSRLYKAIIGPFLKINYEKKSCDYWEFLFDACFSKEYVLQRMNFYFFCKLAPNSGKTFSGSLLASMYNYNINIQRIFFSGFFW